MHGASFSHHVHSASFSHRMLARRYFLTSHACTALHFLHRVPTSDFHVTCITPVCRTARMRLVCGTVRINPVRSRARGPSPVREEVSLAVTAQTESVCDTATRNPVCDTARTKPVCGIVRAKPMWSPMHTNRFLAGCGRSQCVAHCGRAQFLARYGRGQFFGTVRTRPVVAPRDHSQFVTPRGQVTF